MSHNVSSGRDALVKQCNESCDCNPETVARWANQFHIPTFVYDERWNADSLDYEIIAVCSHCMRPLVNSRSRA